jgi:hypothetical protein
MPKGDPAGYLPNVVKSRKSKGEPAYQPRSQRAGHAVGRKPFVGGKSVRAESRIYGGGERSTEDEPGRIYRPRAQRGIGRSGRRPT